VKIYIEIECDGAAFEDRLSAEVAYLLGGVVGKIDRMLKRKPCLCEALESDDLIKDSNGNTVGRVKVRKEKNDPGKM